ncbi:hypothetical protein E5672_13685 [Alteromonas portus]|uniref:Uncharacterized protein n=1 Tax=Alteromonas portus TaxID=2565549 RepID=A0A4U0ZCY5_9ALTE|nr:hypothetical protein [Alteromonas portus]TKB02158.1 hypothetical protein E5672_13685 [Alteromonas portus]
MNKEIKRSLFYLVITTIVSLLVLENVGSGIELISSRRGSEVHIFVIYVLSLFFVGYSLFSLVRAVAFTTIGPDSFWRKNIWDIILGPVPDNSEKQ